MNSGDSQGNTPLHFTCTNGHSGCAFLLLEAKCSIALSNNRGDTALHQASRYTTCKSMSFTDNILCVKLSVDHNISLTINTVCMGIKQACIQPKY